MANNTAFSTTGALPKNLSTNPFGSTSGGLIGNINKATGVAPTQSFAPKASISPTPQSSPITGGTNSGLFSLGGPVNTKPDTTYTSTVTSNNKGGTTTKPTPNPSVLAQQQALNKQGAGLVEDGLAGPLTQAAIAKYANTDTKTETPKLTSDTPTPKLPEVVPPAQLTTGGLVPELQKTAGQTGNEATTFTGLVKQSQNQGQAYTDAMSNYNKAKQDLAEYETKLAQTNKNIASQGISLESARGQEANIGQAATAEHAALQGAVNAASNVLSAANQQQGLQVQAGTAANTAAQTQAQRATGVAGTALGAVAPITGVTPGTQIVQPGMLGTSAGVSGGISDADMKQYATMAANGQIAAIPSSITNNMQLNAELNRQAKLINPNYDPITSSATGDILAKLPALKTAATSLYSVFDSVISSFNDLPQTFKSDSRWINSKLSDLSKYTGAGATEVQKFSSSVSEARIQLSQTINSAVNAGVDMGGQTATSLLPDNMTTGQVATQLDLARKFVNDRIAATASAGGNYNANLTGVGTPGSSTGAMAEVW
jgi:hypothetical protein